MFVNFKFILFVIFQGFRFLSVIEKCLEFSGKYFEISKYNFDVFICYSMEIFFCLKVS